MAHGPLVLLQLLYLRLYLWYFLAKWNLAGPYWWQLWSKILKLKIALFVYGKNDVFILTFFASGITRIRGTHFNIEEWTMTVFTLTSLCHTVKILNFGHPKIYCNHPKSWTRWCFFRVMHPKYEEGIANSVDPDQTALGLHCLPRPVCPKS